MMDKPSMQKLSLIDCVCGKTFSQRVVRCPHCGKSKPQKIRCTICNSEVVKGISPCKNCGDPEPEMSIKIDIDDLALGYSYIVAGSAVDPESKRHLVSLIIRGDITKETEAWKVGACAGSTQKIKEISDLNKTLFTAQELPLVKLFKCQKCSHEYSERSNLCPNCGLEPLMQCVICLEEIPIQSRFCPECGDENPFENANNVGKDIEKPKVTRKKVKKNNPPKKHIVVDRPKPTVQQRKEEHLVPHTPPAKRITPHEILLELYQSKPPNSYKGVKGKLIATTSKTISAISDIKDCIKFSIESKENDLFAIAEYEFENGLIDRGLYARALVNAKGDENMRKVEYMKLRVKQIKIR
jgi:hypothetical protein